MTLLERAERFRKALDQYLSTRRNGVSLLPEREVFDAAVAELIAPVCSHEGCEQTGYLTFCHACVARVCPDHRVHGTGVTGEPVDTCFDCAPGPEPQEW